MWEIIASLAAPLVGQALGSFFEGDDYSERMPENRANEYLNKIPGILEPHYKPYEEAGQRALPTLERQYAKLLDNPELLLNQLGSGYKSSPGYNFKTQEALRAANQIASSGGYLGSPTHQKMAANSILGNADNDYYNYLQNALGLYNTGLGGVGSLANLGYTAASSLGENLAGNALNQANLAYTTGQNQLMRNRSTYGQLGNLLMQLTSGFLNKGINTSKPINENILNFQNPNAYWTSSSLNSRPINNNNFLGNYYNSY